MEKVTSITNRKILVKKRIRNIHKENNVFPKQLKKAEEQKRLNKDLFTMFDKKKSNNNNNNDEVDLYEDLFTITKIADIQHGLLFLNAQEIEKTKCTRCNKQTMKREPFCKSCGYKQNFMIKCVKCLYTILPADKFCMMCGQEQRLIKICKVCNTQNIHIRKTCYSCNTRLNSDDN